MLPAISLQVNELEYKSSFALLMRISVMYC